MNKESEEKNLELLDSYRYKALERANNVNNNRFFYSQQRDKKSSSRQLLDKLRAMPKIADSNPRNVNEENRLNVSKIEKNPKKKKSKKKFLFEDDENNEDDEIIAMQNEGRNLKNMITSRQNIHFQVINADTISMELDFEADEKIQEILLNNEAHRDADTTLWLAPFNKYEPILNAISEYHRSGKTRIAVFPFSDLVTKIREKTDFNKLVFKNDDGRKITIDYEDDEEKKIDNIPLLENLYPFQREGIKFAISKHARMLLADEMG
jgi:hypothetical protein